MVYERIPAKKVNVSVLGTELTFRCGKKVKNRFFKAALSEKLATWDAKELRKRGVPTQELINIYDKWGHGGYGVIVTGNVCVDPRHLESAGNLIISKENVSQELKKKFQGMAKVSKNDGAAIIAQISHSGSQTPRAINEHPFSVSDVLLVSKNVKAGKPIPLTTNQVKTEVVDRFVYAAKFLFEAGFDGVEIHAAHGFLLSQFLSSSTNKRTDKYGGSIENRARVILEIHECIRKEIPASTGFIVGVKMNCVELWKDGLTVEEAAAACSIMERCGVDFVELCGSPMSHKNEESRKREGYFLAYADQIRPVFKNTILYVTGGFRTAAAMVAAIKSNSTDGIGLGRPTTAEPDLPIKILKHSVLSAADTKVDQDDFFMTYLVCIAQMGQMAKKPASSLKSVCDGIADLSRPEEAENFKNQVADYVREITRLNEENKPIYGVFQYTSLY